MTNSGMFQSFPKWFSSHVTISGLMMAPSAPEVFIAALTTPAWLPPMSMQVLHDEPSVNMLAVTATAISVAANIGWDTIVAKIMHDPAIT